MKTIYDTFSGYTEKPAIVPNEQESALVQYCKVFSSITTNSFYVIDISQKRFLYIESDDLFLCGHSVEDAMKLGLDFYTRIIHPEDLPLWTNILDIVLRFLNGIEEGRDNINYFSCAFRLLREFSFISSPLPLIVNQRMKPVWIGGELCYLICSMESTSIMIVGKLRLHSTDKSQCKEYDFVSKRWKPVRREVLTERESAILMLAKQGKCSKEIANDLCRGQNTIQNQINSLFKKLGVHSMQDAIEIADYADIMYSRSEKHGNNQSSDTKKRCLLSKDRLQRIQQHLNQHKSIRKIARLEDTSESAIRYWINKGILTKV